jgi:MFS family permease
MPSTLSLITASFPADGRGRAIGIWAGIAGLGGMLGIFMTGLILQHYSWHGVFLVPAVLAVALAIAGCTVRPSRERVARPLDLPGAGLSALAVGALISGILQSADDGWGSPVVIGALVAAVVLGAVFIWTELRRAHPMLDMRLFGNRALTLGSMSMIVQFIAAFGAIYGVTQYLQLVLGYSPLVSGLALWPVAVSMMPLAVVSAYLAERIGLRLVTGAGLAVVVAGTVLVGRLGPHSPYLSTAIAVAVLGAGIGLAGPAGTAAIMDNIPADSYGVGSAINDVTREIGAALGIALAGSIMSSGYTHRMTAAAAALPPGARHAVTSSIATALPVAARLAGPGRAVADAARAAFCHGMWISSAAIAGVVAVGAIAALLVRTPARPRRPES